MRFGCQLYMLIRISLLCLSFPSQSFLYIWASAVALSAAQLKSGRLCNAHGGSGNLHYAIECVIGICFTLPVLSSVMGPGCQCPDSRI